MVRFGMLMLVLAAGLPPAAMAAGKQAEKPAGGGTFAGRVVRVLDGDTLVLDGDRRVRLLDINTPERGHDGRADEPGAREAEAELRRLAFGQYVTVQSGRMKKDKFDRLLGHVFLENGGWVNGTLVRDGYAHVYTFADNAMYGPELLAYEQRARQQRTGIWALPVWQVRPAAGCCAREDIGGFRLVEGKVLAAAHVKAAGGERTYLNFGRDWRTDYSVFIADKDAKWFKKAGIKNIGDHYRGKTVRIRGFLQPVNGVLVRVTHPEQIEIVE